MKEQLSFEQTPENEGRRVLRVVIGRHGPKLSAEGEKNAKAAYFDEHVREGYEAMDIDVKQEGLVHIGTSDVKRAVDTAEIHSNMIADTEHRYDGVVSPRENLTVPYQPAEDAEDSRYAKDLETIMEIQRELKPIISAEVEQDMSNSGQQEKEAELRNRIDMEVMSRLFADSKKDQGEDRIFEMPVKAVADRFAKRYAGFARHTDLMTSLHKQSEAKDIQPEDEPYLQIDISHSFPITAFLKEYLIFDDGVKAHDLSPKDFFERTGGIVRESGSIEMDYVESNDGGLMIKVQGEFEEGHAFSGILDKVALDLLSPAKKNNSL